MTGTGGSTTGAPAATCWTTTCLPALLPKFRFRLPPLEPLLLPPRLNDEPLPELLARLELDDDEPDLLSPSNANNTATMSTAASVMKTIIAVSRIVLRISYNS